MLKIFDWLKKKIRERFPTTNLMDRSRKWWFLYWKVSGNVYPGKCRMNWMRPHHGPQTKQLKRKIKRRKSFLFFVLCCTVLFTSRLIGACILIFSLYKPAFFFRLERGQSYINMDMKTYTGFFYCWNIRARPGNRDSRRGRSYVKRNILPQITWMALRKQYL